MSPRDRAHRSPHEIRRDETRYSRQRDYLSQTDTSSRRDGREVYHANRSNSFDSQSDRHVIERSPLTSSTRHHDHNHSHHRHHHRHRRSSNHSTRTTPDELPFGARPLVRSDFETFKPLFAQYLDVQKRKDIATMDEREIRGRWKSFVGKWNHGDLAEGWYRPETLSEARKSGATSAYAQPSTGGKEGGVGIPPSVGRGEQDHSRKSTRSEEEEDDGDQRSNDDDDDDEYGPTLPPPATSPSPPAKHRHGPGIPSLQDLDLRRESAQEERLRRIDELRLARRVDRAEQKARLEDLVPRAEAGTRERRLEKKREVNEKMRAFRERSPGVGGEVGEAELMGGAADGDGDGRRTEREVRREEEVRARMKEREDRVREYKKKEEGTMEVLRRIARERFG
ncbi:hypothetical protein K449DRAFT_387580 [Hypoxylon sp. EC38]|nr:hypothetical protein K449DRAFT_387580 [Hypoxylon sp. EC38]